ncbi:uncharacterized protein cd164l2 isoform X2 [Alosa alosa]|uniref:uncharacterized protein cd164l2 isoform X3 n=1 Tax=Alosa sapidissima TaxID=34773 RepID=UPI001C0911CF|nr:uncharacterized protein cd164l2 isoform X3 [Alosa sapidissima]XP_048085987.1 uncharacterized protein cd164l2 isoform X2 [Alosa alosa]
MRGLLLVLLGTLLTLEVIQMITAQTAADDVANGDCKRMDSCDQCVSLSLNNTGCVWRICDNENNTGCVSDTEDFQGCNRLNETDMCAGTDIDIDIDIDIGECILTPNQLLLRSSPRHPLICPASLGGLFLYWCFKQEASLLCGS